MLSRFGATLRVVYPWTAQGARKLGAVTKLAAPSAAVKTTTAATKLAVDFGSFDDEDSERAQADAEQQKRDSDKQIASDAALAAALAAADSAPYVYWSRGGVPWNGDCRYHFSVHFCIHNCRGFSVQCRQLTTSCRVRGNPDVTLHCSGGKIMCVLCFPSLGVCHANGVCGSQNPALCVLLARNCFLLAGTRCRTSVRVEVHVAAAG